MKSWNKKYNKTNFMVYSCQYHVIFCPKYRKRVLVPPIDTRLKELLREKAKEINCKILGMEVMPDHVHLLLDVNPQYGIHKTISVLKGYTSNKLRQEFSSLRTKIPTLWTHSKFISSVGTVSLEVAKKYIEEQKNK